MPKQNNLDSTHIERHLAEAQSRAEQGEYAAAVSAVREAKSLAPKNIYILAFEKQAEQLNELDAAKNLTDEQRTDILESIPSIIERALESSRSPGTQTDITALRPGGDANQEKKEKAAALEWLKNQYFQHAHEYIQKGEYQNALAEIRRVYIIDPSNAIARDFEKQFEALDQLKRGDSVRVYPTVPTASTAPRHTPVAAAPPKPQPGSRAPDTASIVIDEHASPAQPKREAPNPVKTQEKNREKKKGSLFLIVLILVSLAVLAALSYTYYQKKIYKKPIVVSQTVPRAEQFIGAPAETAEQNFLVSNDDTSSGTPQVTELAVNANSPPAAGKKGTGAAKAPPRETPDPGSEATVRQQEEPETSPLVMATQAQPDVKQPDVKAPASQPTAEDTASPAPFVAIEKQARIIRLETPKFTMHGLQVGVQGQVVIQVRIDEMGKPVQTVTLKSTNDQLIQPVIDAVMASQFAPAEMTTGPIASWLTIPFRFATR